MRLHVLTSFLLIGYLLHTARAQTVGDACSSDTNCTATLEACNTTCECNSTYINPGTGTCVLSACSDYANCTAQSIQNSQCSNSSCECDVLSEASTATNSTLGACIPINCTTNGDCSGTNAVCDTTTDPSDPVCACDTTYILTEGACIARVIGSTCTTASAQCSGISNAYCISSACACGPLYSGASCAAKTCTQDTDCPTNAFCSSTTCACDSLSVEDSATGECEAIVCTANGGQCSGANSVCDTTTDPNAPICTCNATYILSEGACIARVYGDSCSSDANCVDINATDAVCDTTATPSLCKIGSGKSCTGNTDKCVSNAACGSDSVCACNTGYDANTNGLCNSGAGAIVMSAGIMLMSVIMLII